MFILIVGSEQDLDEEVSRHENYQDARFTHTLKVSAAPELSKKPAKIINPSGEICSLYASSGNEEMAYIYKQLHASQGAWI